MTIIDQWVARKEVFKFIEQLNGNPVKRESFYFLCVLIIANALVYIGDCIANLKEK